MKTGRPNCPKNVCEKLLIEEKRYNIENNILPSENEIVDRLLARSAEMTDVYEELHNKLIANMGAIRSFLGLALSTAAFWSPEKILVVRDQRKCLEDTNLQIAQKASELAHLLDKQSKLHNASTFTSNTHYHVCKVIEAASKENSRFEYNVQKPLANLRRQFDLKYWPTLGEFVGEISINANNARIETMEPLTAASIAAKRPSLADYFKALFMSIEENRIQNGGLLPRDFTLTDNTLAILANCSLDLGPNDLRNGPYVKRLRQRIRDECPPEDS